MNNPRYSLEEFSKKFPQLLMPIKEDMRSTKLYRAAVLSGQSIEKLKTIAKEEMLLFRLDFIESDKDWIKTYNTPAGDVVILYFNERKDFEHACCALGNYCQPKNFPKSMGALCISGILDWDKANSFLGGFETRNDGFEELQKNINDFKISIIIVSDGPYSAVPASSIDINEDEWIDKSLKIRIYHELAHFVRNKTFNKQNDNALYEEVIADMCGIVFAFGNYDTKIAKASMGIYDGKYKDGSRLQNYLSEGQDINDIYLKIGDYIDDLYNELMKHDLQNILVLVKYNLFYKDM